MEIDNEGTYCPEHGKATVMTPTHPSEEQSSVSEAFKELLEFALFVQRGVYAGKIKSQPFFLEDPNAASLDLQTLGSYAASVIARATSLPKDANHD